MSCETLTLYVDIRYRMSDLRYPMSFFTATPCCPNHPGTPSHALGIWAEPFEQYAHPLGLALGEQW